jgi:hypothetical protein
VFGDRALLEIEELFVRFIGVMRFAINHRDRMRVFFPFRVQPGDQLIKLLKIGVIVWLPEWINHNRMNLAAGCRYGFFPGGRRLGSWSARRGGLHTPSIAQSRPTSKSFTAKIAPTLKGLLSGGKPVRYQRRRSSEHRNCLPGLLIKA